MKRRIIHIPSALAIVITLVLVTAVQIATPVRAALSGPNDGSTAADDVSIGTVTWTSVNNALIQDDSPATASLSKTNPVSHYLQATGFGFSIPSSAMIKGIAVEVDRYSSTGTGGTRVGDNSIRLLKAGLTVGDDKASASLWPASDTDTYVSYGNSTDLWGLAWAPDDINNADFGVAISAKKDSANGNRNAYIDHVRITVYYNQAPMANPQGGLSIDSCSSLVVVLSGSDPDSDPLTYMISRLPTLGDLYEGEGIGGPLITSVPYDVTDTGHKVTYQPKASYSGDDSFGFKVNDGTVDSTEAAISITVGDGRSTWYEDSDNDAYGNSIVYVLACAKPAGYVSDNTDCDDSDAAVNPGATEVCNGIDDDCDSQVDEGVTTTYYCDSDSDGYGDPIESTQACSQPSGYILDNTDCDDNDASVNPGATEVPYNGKDDDCNLATLDEVLLPSGDPTVTTQAASGVTASSATMNMSYGLGNCTSLEVRFSYKKSAATAWSYTIWVVKTAGGTHTDVVSGLDSDTTYEFKGQLRYNDTVIEGTVLQFSTGTPPPWGSSGGCFIATAAYGTSTAPQLDLLREFRDVVLLKTAVGSQCVALYYRFSPPVADFIGGHEAVRTLVRELLIDPIVWLVDTTGSLWRS